MISRHNRLVATFVIASFALISVFGQGGGPSQNPTPPKESSKYRIICTAAGAGGAYTLGVFAGIAAYDDATFAERKIWTLALALAAAGGVGGYFLGRAIDKRHSRVSVPVTADNFDRSLMKAQYQLEGLPTVLPTERWRAAGLAFCPPDDEAQAVICPTE